MSLVVVYHVWIGRVSGGVDVFFVIAGFLLVGQLTRAVVRGSVDLIALWGRSLRRLVPTTMVVLTASGLAGMLILPESRWTQTVHELVASEFFVQNWRLAADSVDYYAAHDTASIVQHLWSLSLQGQLAVALPALVVVLALAARRWGADVAWVIAAALGVLTAGSFVWSVVLTAVDQPLAYFHSGTRLWEFTLGGLLALVIDRIVLTRIERVVLGWVGVLALVTCGLVVDIGAAFPGWLALWPVLAACCVLVAGHTRHPRAVDGVLVSAPLRYLGSLSFALYLWHWPVLVLGLVLTGRSSFGLEGGLAVIALSLALAALTHHLVEQPLMRAPIGRFARRGEYRLVALTMVPVLLVVAVWSVLGTTKEQPTLVLGDPAHPGAASLVGAGDHSARDAPLVPSAMTVGQDWALSDACHATNTANARQVCPVTPGAPGGRRLLVVGDSHSEQFVPALEEGARAHGWQISSMVLGGCPFALGWVPDTAPDGCSDRNQAALAAITRLRPDGVVVAATRDVRSGRTESTPAGYVAAWRAVTALGIPVVAVRDNPRFAASPSTCALETPQRGCAVPRADLYGPAPYAGIPDLPAGVSFLDPTDSYCPGDTCPAVIGRVLVYLDDNHITASYSRTLGPTVDRELTRLLR